VAQPTSNTVDYSEGWILNDAPAGAVVSLVVAPI